MKTYIPPRLLAGVYFLRPLPYRGNNGKRCSVIESWVLTGVVEWYSVYAVNELEDNDILLSLQ